MEMTDHKELTKNERSKETVNNAKNVNSENNDMFEMAEANNSLDAPHDEMKSAIDTAITETNSNSIFENVNTEMVPEIRTINTKCVNDDPIIDADISTDKALSEPSVSSLENETKKKRKKRKSIKSNEEQIIIEKAIENNMDQTNTSATEPTSVEVMGKTELAKKEDTNNEAIKANDVNENNHKTIGMTEANTSLDTPVEKNPSLETMKKETRPISNVKIETELAPEMIIVDKENASDVKNINSEAVSAFSAEKDTMKKNKKRKSIKSHQEEIDAEQDKLNDNDRIRDTKPKEESTKKFPEKAHTTQTNKDPDFSISSEATISKIIPSPNVKDIDTDLTPGAPITDEKYSTDVQTVESQLSNDKNLNSMSASTLERETRKKKKKRKSIKSLGEELDAEKLEPHDVNARKATVVERRLSLKTKINEDIFDLIAKDIEAEMGPDEKAIDTESVTDVKSVESEAIVDTNQNTLSVSLTEKEPKKKKKKRKSIKSMEELVIETCTKCKILLAPQVQQRYCRGCGENFCSECCSKSESLPWVETEKEVNLCDTCYEIAVDYKRKVNEAAKLRNTKVTMDESEATVKNSEASTKDAKNKLHRRSNPGDDSGDISNVGNKIKESSSDKVQRRSYAKDNSNEKRNRRRGIIEDSDDDLLDKICSTEVANDTLHEIDINESCEEVVYRKKSTKPTTERKLRRRSRKVEEINEVSQKETGKVEEVIKDMQEKSNAPQTSVESLKSVAPRETKEDQNVPKLAPKVIDASTNKTSNLNEKEIKPLQKESDVTLDTSDKEHVVTKDGLEIKSDQKHPQQCSGTEQKPSVDKSDEVKADENKPKRITLPIIYKNKSAADKLNKRTFTIKAPEVKLRQNCFKKASEERPKSESDILHEQAEASQTKSEESIKEENKRRSLNEETKPTRKEEEISDDEITDTTLDEITDNPDFNEINKMNSSINLKIASANRETFSEKPDNIDTTQEIRKELKEPMKELSEDDFIKAVCEKRTQIKNLENVAQEMINSKWKEVEKYNNARKKVENDTENLKKQLKNIDLEIKQLNENKVRIRKQCQDNKYSIVKLNESRLQYEEESCAQLMANKREMSERQQELLELIMKKPLQSVANEKTKLSLLDIYDRRIEAKRREIECPVCSQTAPTPIFMCPSHHLICSCCFLKVDCCPQCQASYPLGEARRNRSADLAAEELAALIKERQQVANNGQASENEEDSDQVDEVENEGDEMQSTAENKTNGHAGAIQESPTPCRRNVLNCFNIQVPAGIPPHIAQSAAELYDVEMKHMGETEFEEFMKDWSPNSPMYLYLRELRSKVR